MSSASVIFIKKGRNGGELAHEIRKYSSTSEHASVGGKLGPIASSKPARTIQTNKIRISAVCFLSCSVLRLKPEALKMLGKHSAVSYGPGLFVFIISLWRWFAFEFFYLLFLRQGLPYCPRIHYVDQAGLKTDHLTPLPEYWDKKVKHYHTLLQ